MAKYMTPELVAEIRERHLFLRELDPDRAAKDLDRQVAEEFTVSQSHLRDIVTGLVHPDAPGPIDVGRARRRELYRTERETLGDREARRRLNLRTRGIDPEPKAVRYVQRVVIVDHRGKDTEMSYTMEPGHSIRVDLVAEGGR